MIQFTKKLDDPNGLVHKLIFEDNDSIAESVLYHYNDRVVVCFSTQSGCPVGCRFCGTGNKFIRNLSPDEMMLQIEKSLSFIKTSDKNIQLMSMSMGEPMLNWDSVEKVAEHYLKIGFNFFISTIGIKDWSIFERIISIGEKYDKFGLQFSLHNTNDEERLNIFRNKDIHYMSVNDILNIGREFTLRTNRPAYFNYIITGKETDENKLFIVKKLKGMHLTCSVLCNISSAIKTDPDKAISFANELLEMSNGMIEVSTFDPSGQDTIGGGCGQLLYVQEKMKKLKLNAINS